MWQKIIVTPQVLHTRVIEFLFCWHLSFCFIIILYFILLTPVILLTNIAQTKGYSYDSDFSLVKLRIIIQQWWIPQNKSVMAVRLWRKMFMKSILELMYYLLPSPYESQEINHLTLAYFVISGLGILDSWLKVHIILSYSYVFVLLYLCCYYCYHAPYSSVISCVSSFVFCSFRVI